MLCRLALLNAFMKHSVIYINVQSQSCDSQVIPAIDKQTMNKNMPEIQLQHSDTKNTTSTILKLTSNEEDWEDPKTLR